MPVLRVRGILPVGRPGSLETLWKWQETGFFDIKVRSNRFSDLSISIAKAITTS
ncbi:MAG: hypothetical protein SXA11_20575 [Cyanobacteriota bacterium]|nr:hypothetical protein [Cyanobacteriota bacterium]